MPTYTFHNTETGDIFDDFVSMADKDKLLELNPHIVQVLTPVAIVSGVGGVRNDAGWNETLSKIAEAHPDSPLAQRTLRRDSKQVKTARAVQKWRNSHKP